MSTYDCMNVRLLHSTFGNAGALLSVRLNRDHVMVISVLGFVDLSLHLLMGRPCLYGAL